jgi:hypothetical protein
MSSSSRDAHDRRRHRRAGLAAQADARKVASDSFEMDDERARRLALGRLPLSSGAGPSAFAMDAGRRVGVDRDFDLRRLRRFPVAILGEGLAHAGNSGRVGHREVVARLQHLLAGPLDLVPTCSRNVRSVLSTTRAPLMASRAAVIASHCSLAASTQRLALGDLDKVDRADDRARAADRADHLPEHARVVRDLDRAHHPLRGRCRWPRRGVARPIP